METIPVRSIRQDPQPVQVIGSRARGQSSLSISIILIFTKEGKRKMNEAKLCPPEIMAQKYLKAGIHLLISSRGREKKGEAEGTSVREGGSWESAHN